MAGDQEDEPPADMPKAVAAQNSNLGNDLGTLPTPPCVSSSNNFIEHNNDWVTLCSDKGQGQLSSNDLSSEFINCIDADQGHETVTYHPIQSSLDGNDDVGVDASQGDLPPHGVRQPLVEQKIQDAFFSPDKGTMKSDTPPDDGRISSEATACKENIPESRFATSIQSSSSSVPLEIIVDNPALGMFEETPLKKSLESPSAWMSPWSSFVPGPILDTDITIEDIGYLMSPGERSYDALGLMKQLSEHTASAYANAREVLGDETPDSILKKRFTDLNTLGERRVLDFSECVSTRTRDPSASHSNDITFSSPSSYLLKGFR
ncbi:hypothetical protein L1987_80775 [Smallanthus sonchifolius]|uniref:Uncharacterized protein n=1 Tax=Smallanthus sonchifolius TaxID=185202 RepID=A0ACB8YQ71_9ASTR|nr:hypothetical protein L1987_80775 [Smallanthus sonchifolius]